MVQNFLTHILDFLFPPNPEEIRLRTFSAEKFSENVTCATKNEFPFIHSLFSYKDPLVRELIWQIKYKKNAHTLQIAGYALYHRLTRQNENISSGSITLIPIPISKQRRKQRGFNQSELIIDEIMKLDIDNKFTKDYDLLIRTKDIEKQTLKNRDERIMNTQHIFKIIKKPEQDQKIIIIDDVSTTGSTLKEAREELIKNGYRNIECLTIAH